MKIYMVVHCGYEFSENMGAFSNRNNAEKYRKELINERVCDIE